MKISKEQSQINREAAIEAGENTYEGHECIKCGSNIRYVKLQKGKKNGRCVECKRKTASWYDRKRYENGEAWQQKNPNLFGPYDRAHKAGIQWPSAHFTDQEIEDVGKIYAEAADRRKDGICATVDHLVPLSKGGSMHALNSQIVSKSENCSKYNNLYDIEVLIHLPECCFRKEDGFSKEKVIIDLLKEIRGVKHDRS